MNKAKKTIKIYYLQPAFLICVVTLAIAAVGMNSLIGKINPFFIKVALPLQNSLDDIDETKLGHYVVGRKSKIKNHQIEEALGTKDYIQWELVDTEQPANSPVRYCSLFITYYTGNPDQVPHVPEECYTGGGAQKFGADSYVFDADGMEVPAKCLTFSNKAKNLLSTNSKFNVFYFFKVNGKFAGSRDSARGFLQRNFASKYSYFSKVEWKFYNVTAMGANYPKKEQAVEASKKLLKAVVPVLNNYHWPDWEKANSELATKEKK